MMSRATWPYAIVLRVVLVLGALTFSVIQTPPAARAQSCTNCVVAAGVPLNLLQEPRLEAKVLHTIPQGSLLVRGTGAETNRLVPITYGGLSGWVIADGIFPAPETQTYATTSSPTASSSPSTTSSPNTRETLAPLMLRSVPAMEAEPILIIPHGGVVMLTWEGAENGYVTVDYGGVRGWAYADLLAEPVRTGPSGTRGVTTVNNDGVVPGVEEPVPVSEVTVAEEPVPVAGDCDPSYPDLCIPPVPPDLICDDTGVNNFTVLPPDPHGFDNDGDGVGCESP